MSVIPAHFCLVLLEANGTNPWSLPAFRALLSDIDEEHYPFNGLLHPDSLPHGFSQEEHASLIALAKAMSETTDLDHPAFIRNKKGSRHTDPYWPGRTALARWFHTLWKQSGANRHIDEFFHENWCCPLALSATEGMGITKVRSTQSLSVQLLTLSRKHTSITLLCCRLDSLASCLDQRHWMTSTIKSISICLKTPPMNFSEWGGSDSITRVFKTSAILVRVS